MAAIDKIVLVTRKTALMELIERFNTLGQARFYVEHMGVSFDEYERAHGAYLEARAALRELLPRKVKRQELDRGFLPNFTFGKRDVVITLGPDGLVINTAKYLSEQPIVALNPDPSRIDGILNPLSVLDTPLALDLIARGEARIARVTMASASLNDGQELYAVNDLFIGHRSHASARYRLQAGDRCEDQSSSGIIVSTGAGSTGWLRSILVGSVRIATGMCAANASLPENDGRFDWEAEELRFFVREPFPSRTSKTDLVCGRLPLGGALTVTSMMPEQGVIFSDGIETDYLAFNTGAIARIEVASRKAHLVQRSW